jgi:hypothetical protein
MRRDDIHQMDVCRLLNLWLLVTPSLEESCTADTGTCSRPDDMF